MKSKISIVLVGLIAVVLGAEARGVPLATGSWTNLPGTTAAADPQLAGPIIASTSQAFSFPVADGGTVSGTVSIRVIRSNVDNTLDFQWRVLNDSTSDAEISQFRLGRFYSPEYDADYRTDGLGDYGPDRAYHFDVPKSDYVNFNFVTGLQAGDSSHYFFLDTTATHYAKRVLYDLDSPPNFISGQFFTYGPLFLGDVDLNGVVDTADIDDFIAVLQGNLSDPDAQEAADTDENGVVDTADIDEFIELLQASGPTGPSPTVPEPATLALLALGSLTMLSRRR